MAFVADVIKSLMAKGLTRKQAKELFNEHPIAVGSSVHRWADLSNSRQVNRKLQREGGPRHPTYRNGYKVLCHKKGHRLGIPLSHPTGDMSLFTPVHISLREPSDTYGLLRHLYGSIR